LRQQNWRGAGVRTVPHKRRTEADEVLERGSERESARKRSGYPWGCWPRQAK